MYCHVFSALNVDTKRVLIICALTELDIKQVQSLCRNKKKMQICLNITINHTEVTALKRSLEHYQCL